MQKIFTECMLSFSTAHSVLTTVVSTQVEQCFVRKKTNRPAQTSSCEEIMLTIAELLRK